SLSMAPRWATRSEITSFSAMSISSIRPTRSSWAPPRAARTSRESSMRSKICLLGSLVLAVSVRVAQVHAEPAAKSDRGRQAYSEGEAAYRLGRYDEAAKRYEESYRLTHYPTILFDIAQCYRRQYETDHDVAHLRKALDLYRAFRRDAPSASK